MSFDLRLPSIAFVWLEKDIAPALVETARRTGTKALFDVSASQLENTSRALLHANADANSVELKVSSSAILDGALPQVLRETGIQRLWVELHSAAMDRDAHAFFDRILELSPEFSVVPVLGDAELIDLVLSQYPGIKELALKGSEAAGFVSSETIFTLHAAVRARTIDRSEPPDLFIWGGIATPEAAAAFLSAGARGIVFESVHWLTDLAGPNDDVRKRLANLRPDHTDLVGLNLAVPCRLFNKGNSTAVKELKEFAGSLCGGEIRDEQKRFFAQRIRNELVMPLSAKFARDELIPLGIEAGFAASFARRFGNRTEDAVRGFVQALEGCLAAAPERAKAFAQSPVAADMGTRFPFIQGAMSWITDVPEFSRKVADAGGLPTLALGLMDSRILNERLGRVNEVMEDLPYAVNVITLAENPYREEQLAWIREKRPRFAVIAAGEPSFAKRFLEEGIEPIYIAPSEELLKLALEAGVRYVICEGNEAGGHVGQHSTLTLAQMAIDLKQREPELLRGRHIILAGGICNRETAFMAAMLGADAVQMGTAYLATSEIVETGALTDLYRRMILSAPLGGTAVTGEGTGLRVRSLRTSRIEAICALERDFAAGSEDEASFRRKIEHLSAGSLFVAARGLDKPGGDPLDEASCREQGQYMSGACAAVVKQVNTLSEFHLGLAEGPLAQGVPFTGPVVDVPVLPARPISVREAGGMAGDAHPLSLAGTKNGKERIAITGMAAVNSLGNSPEEIWAACLAGKSGIVPVPNTRWNHEQFFHPRPRTPEKTYCRVGAFQHIEVTRKDIGVPPQDFRTMTDSTKLTMWLARRAVEQSGILDSDIPRERIAVLISQNSGEAAATLQDVIIRGALGNIVSAVKRVVQLTPENERAVEEEIKAGRIAIDDTTLLGRLNCSAAGFICNKYGFNGPSFSVSAACATALVALYSAYQMIRNGIIDAAVVGGAEEYLTPMHFLEFSALGALAGLTGVNRPASETSRPFDADRDGMVLGEGGGVIVIERESVARKRGAAAHAYITSMGASNNHLGMVESSRVTQEIAIGASFKDASYGPEGVDMIECHATSTRQGDVEEVQALRTFFKPDKATVLTSFKSQIGHTLGASGVNSLVRGIMAMNAGIFPPTLNYTTPDPEMELEGSGLVVHPEPTSWDVNNGRPRRLQVNAFGFGGSNYVVQVEQALKDNDVALVSPVGTAEAAGQAGSSVSDPEGISFFRTEIGGMPHLVAVVAENESDAKALVQKTEPFTNGSIAPKRLKALARQGIHVGPEEASPKPMAFVYPGQGSHYAGMSHELYKTFPVIREWMDRAAEVAEFDLLQLLFYDNEEDLQKTRWQQPALFTMEFAMVQYLLSLGITPVAQAGHSLGELTALCVAGVYSFEDGFRIVNKRAICMDRACQENVDPGIMMAVDAPMDVIQDKLSRVKDVYITNYNSPHQIVIGGNTQTVTALGEELKAEGHRRTKLRVSMAFHSPIMTCIHDELEAFIAEVPFHAPKIPVISNTTMKPFPDNAKEIKRIVMAHLESPVRWMENTRTLWDDYGVRLFVEVGPREILSNMIADIIEEAECIQTCLPSAEALMYKTALAQLYAKGHLVPKRRPSFISFPSTAKSPEPALPATRVALPVRTAPQAGTVEGIIQREINAFVMDSFGRFLRPGLLAAIRREHDSQFSEDELNALLGSMFGSAPMTVPVVQAYVPVQPELPPAPKAQQEIVSEVQVPVSEEESVAETVIRIIMEATGYERDEIELDMDLREDLSIRSSRLPVIMDALEAQFGIKIELEEFMDVRTVRDISERLSRLTAKGTPKNPGASAQPVSTQAPAVPVASAHEERQTLKRVVFGEVQIEAGSVQPVELQPMETVAILSAESGTGMKKQVGTVFRRDYGVNLVPMTYLSNGPSAEGGSFDLRTDQGALLAARALDNLESLAGVVFIIDDLLEEKVNTLEEVSALLRGFFTLLKTFVDSSARKFATCLYRSQSQRGLGNVLAEGVLGMFLSAAHEFGSVQFRCVRLDQATDLRDAIRGSLDRSQKILDMTYRDGSVYTRHGYAADTAFAEATKLSLCKDDVVVFSGGAYGITPALARSLAPFGCKMAFLGRTAIDPDVDFRLIPGDPSLAEKEAREIVSKMKTCRTDADRAAKVASITRAAEILRNMDELRYAGIDASYISCDVTDSQAVSSAIGSVVAKYGKVDGVVHAAGMLKDNFVKQMTEKDFAAVVDVKLLGAWNLFRAARDKGLRFMVGLSSAASIQGNPGQTNYAAANRVMSALLEQLAAEHAQIRFKALMLPPIEGAGMAENQEVRDLMKRMNADYVHVDELAGLFCRELFVAGSDDVWTMFMRSLPDLSTVRLDQEAEPARPGTIHAAAVAFPAETFPMIDVVSRMDIAAGHLEAERSFSQERDLWVSDHKPFKFMKHPLVSAIMAVETFMEATRMLYPYLTVKGLKNAQFLDIIECPKGTERSASIVCKRIPSRGSEVVCDLALIGRDVSPSGRPIERKQPNYKAQIVLGTRGSESFDDFEDLKVNRSDLDSRPMDHSEVLECYRNRTSLIGRYQVVEELYGTSQDTILGRIKYKETADFRGLPRNHYQYPPYLLEGLLQVVTFYLDMRDPHEKRTVIPYEIGEMRFFDTCENGQIITVEARLRNRTDEGFSWDARAFDDRGRTLMFARNITLRWF
jgi:malonyl CoA-acyl carrier protein transacylase